MNIAIIPARGGSKRIPRKNIRPFNGRPIIAWSIRAARQSGLFRHVLVSTDDHEIAEVARQCGAEVPFVRPAELADDYSTTGEVMAHAVRWAGEQGWPLEAACCIYATAPFIRPEDLAAGLEQLRSGHWNYVFSATEFSAPIFRAFKKEENGGLAMFFPQHYKTRSQDLPTALHDAAQFYWGLPDAWRNEQPIFAAHSTIINIPRWRSIDIDTEDDWCRAELMASELMEFRE